MGVRWMLLLIRLCARMKAGYVKVKSVTDAVDSPQSILASSAKVYPLTDSPT